MAFGFLKLEKITHRDSLCVYRRMFPLSLDIFLQARASLSSRGQPVAATGSNTAAGPPHRRRRELPCGRRHPPCRLRARAPCLLHELRQPSLPSPRAPATLPSFSASTTSAAGGRASRGDGTGAGGAGAGSGSGVGEGRLRHRRRQPGWRSVRGRGHCGCPLRRRVRRGSLPWEEEEETDEWSPLISERGRELSGVNCE